MNDTREQLRQDKSEIVAAIARAGGQVKGSLVTCPFHDDKHPSGKLYCDEGTWRFKCHAGSCGFYGDVFDIQARAAGKPLAEVLPRNERREAEASKPRRVFPSVDAIRASVSSLGEVQAVYQYTHPETRRVEVVQVRLWDAEQKRKKFLTHRGEGDGFVLGAPPKPWPIYNRTRVKSAETVVLVEGEKAVHLLAGLGIVATTSLSGSANAKNADFSPLSGKTVYVWPDNDESGQKYADEAIAMMLALESPPRIFRLDVAPLGLPEHGDVEQYIERFPEDARQAVIDILREGCEPVSPGAELRQRVEATLGGEWSSIPWPNFKGLSHFAKALFPGTITVVCGDPGSCKSFLTTDAFYRWHKGGTKVALYMLEDDRQFHLNRLLAMLEENGDILDDDWARDHPNEMLAALARHEADIASFARHLYAEPMGTLRYADMLKWMSEQCERGAVILGIDPVTAVAGGERRDLEDLDFVNKASAILRRHKARLIVVTHPRGGAGKQKVVTADDAAGGRAWSRHTQSVLWVSRFDPPREVVVRTSLGDANVEINRAIKILKGRNGRGHGQSLGYIFGRGLRFAEQGIIVPAASHVST